VPLILIPTPIGNLRDITLRALDALAACDSIVAEDTRVAARLLNAYGIRGKPVRSYREQNAAEVTSAILERAREHAVAVLSDAGMPGISDPGRELVAAARAAGIGVEVLPGASAFVCAAVLSGFALERFSFEGFLPRARGERERSLRAALLRGTTTVWYEAPHRILASLATLAAIAPDADVFVARELTKLHEQQILGKPSAVISALTSPVRGEIVLVLGPFARDEPAASEEQLEAAIDAALAAGSPPAAIAKALSRESAHSRQELYARVIERKLARERSSEGSL
jgi:16S rRNA (cytidine1402-2'-O)-methyltransferase